MFGRKPQAAPPKVVHKKTFNPNDFNITPGRWYHAKNFPNPIKHRQLDGVMFDVIVKAYDAQTDEFTFKRYPDTIVRVIRTAYEGDNVFVWAWGSKIDPKTEKVIAFALPPDWKVVYFQHVTELVQ